MNSTIHLSLPDALREEAEKQAAADGVSLEQFLVNVTSRYLDAERAIQAVRARARQAPKGALEHYLAAVPDVEPIETDRLPEGWTPR